jgi:DNA-directed RNA polymerase specialized sigma24 family protein
MAKIDWVEQRLMRWADVVTSGADGSGFPAMSVLHEDWSPPSPGKTPTMKTVTGSRDVKATHAAIGLLSMRMRNTLVVHYCLRLGADEQAHRLECSIATVYSRLAMAHKHLARLL